MADTAKSLSELMADEDPVRASAPVFGFAEGDVAETGVLSVLPLVKRVRSEFALADHIDDAALLASLMSIVAVASPRARWVRAFSSPLGQALANGGRDVNTSLSRILSSLPRARN